MTTRPLRAASPSRATTGLLARPEGPAPCCQPAAHPGFAILDLDATGPNTATDRIIELAVVLTDEQGTVQREIVTLVDPQTDDIGSTRQHGLTRADLAGAPAFADLAGDILDLLAGRIVIAHNALSTLTLLRSEYARLGLDLPRMTAACTMASAAAFNTDTRMLLVDLAAVAGVRWTGGHTAGDDAELTRRVLQAYLARCRDDRGHLKAFGGDVPLLPAMFDNGALARGGLRSAQPRHLLPAA